MPKPHRVIVKYDDQVYLLDGSLLQHLDPADGRPWVKLCIERANNWRRGLLVNLQAAVAFADGNEMTDDVGAEDSGD